MIPPIVCPPAMEAVILGVLANGLTSVISNMGYNCKKIVIPRKDSEKSSALQPILNNAFEAIEKTIKLGELTEINDISSFLSSREVGSIVRQIYSAKISENENSEFRSSLQEEFDSYFSIFTGIEKGRIREPAHSILDSILSGCQQVLDNAIDEGKLSAHEAKSSLRYNILKDELASIQKILEFFSIQQKPNLQEILEYEKKYSKQVSKRHGIIIPPNFDKADKIPINELYVSPEFIKISKRKNEEQSPISINEFLSVIHRTVLIGTPGCGKSTLTHKVCYDLSTPRSKKSIAGRQVTPILVVLKDYGAEKKSHNCSILQFIESCANDTYQSKPPSNAFEYLILNGHVAVIFDGLDELLDTSYRQEISDDIESFSWLYPSVPILVTSREVGYEQAPLDEKRFEVFRLSPFDDKQIEEYVEKWFALDSDLTREMQEDKVNSFMKESEIVPDLRSNPLMLALMCNIYHGENYIPNNRPEVYEKCATMLFERWDRGRGIPIPRPVEEIKAHIRPTMMYLAYWIYSDETLQGGVTEKSLISKAAEYLNEKRFDDLDEAKNAAQDFIDFCRGRAWVFRDTGTTKYGENIYQFTHRTFLEYFTAVHLIRMNPTPDKLEKILFPRIARAEWDVVAQLSFQIQNKNVDGAADELLNSLVEKANGTHIDGRWNIFSFAVRCLEFIVPRPKTIRQIAGTFIDNFLAFGSKRMDNQEDHEDRGEDQYLRSIENQPGDVWYSLLGCAHENRKTLYETIENVFIERINGGNSKEARLILEITYNLKCETRQLERQRGNICEFSESMLKAQLHILEKCSQRNKEICEEDWNICHIATWQGKIPIEKFVDWHGISRVFDRPHYAMFPGWIHNSIADKLLISFLRSGSDIKERSIIREHFNDLEFLGNYIINLSISRNKTLIKRQFRNATRLFERIIADTFMYRKKVQGLPEELIKNSDAVFGAFALTATLIESIPLASLTKRINLDSVSKEFFKSKRPSYLELVIAMLLLRNNNHVFDIDEELSNFNFTKDQGIFIKRWVDKDIYLTAPTRQ